MKISVFDDVGEFAVAAEDGQKLYARMIDLFEHHETVELDFSGVRVVATPFFNAAVGRLLENVTPQELNSKITFKSLSVVGDKTLKKVIENAKAYYRDPGARAALDKILTEHSDDH